MPDSFLATPARFLLHPPTATAILADLHLGVEASLREAGTLMPDITTGPIRAAWAKVLERRPRRIVIAGDFFHTPEVGEETRLAGRTLLTSAPADCRVTVIPGNHDPSAAVLRRMFRGTAIEVAASVELDGWTVLHGHELGTMAKLPPKLIVGHQHPALVLENRAESAKMICYASVRGGRNPAMIVLPAFSPAPLGSNLRSPRNWIFQTPAPDAADVRIAGIVRDRVLDFGPLAGLQGAGAPTARAAAAGAGEKRTDVD